MHIILSVRVILYSSIIETKNALIIWQLHSSMILLSFDHLIFIEAWKKVITYWQKHNHFFHF